MRCMRSTVSVGALILTCCGVSRAQAAVVTLSLQGVYTGYLNNGEPLEISGYPAITAGMTADLTITADLSLARPDEDPSPSSGVYNSQIGSVASMSATMVLHGPDGDFIHTNTYDATFFAGIFDSTIAFGYDTVHFHASDFTVVVQAQDSTFSGDGIENLFAAINHPVTSPAFPLRAYFVNANLRTPDTFEHIQFAITSMSSTVPTPASSGFLIAAAGLLSCRRRRAAVC